MTVRWQWQTSSSYEAIRQGGQGPAAVEPSGKGQHEGSQTGEAQKDAPLWSSAGHEWLPHASGLPQTS